MNIRGCFATVLYGDAVISPSGLITEIPASVLTETKRIQCMAHVLQECAVNEKGGLQRSLNRWKGAT